MAAAGGTPGEHEGVREVISDLWQLVRDYAKQEMVDPLLMLKEFFLFGVLGALSLCLGLGFGALAIIRALQTETGDHLTGSNTWIPYFVAIVFTGAAVGVCVWLIKRPFRHEEASA